MQISSLLVTSKLKVGTFQLKFSMMETQVEKLAKGEGVFTAFLAMRSVRKFVLLGTIIPFEGTILTFKRDGKRCLKFWRKYSRQIGVFLLPNTLRLKVESEIDKYLLARAISTIEKIEETSEEESDSGDEDDAEGDKATAEGDVDVGVADGNNANMGDEGNVEDAAGEVEVEDYSAVRVQHGHAVESQGGGETYVQDGEGEGVSDDVDEGCKP